MNLAMELFMTSLITISVIVITFTVIAKVIDKLGAK
jgi:hypothetical protein